jgi:hypothetical protein
MTVSSDLIPKRAWYVEGCHAGTSVWRHARTPLTPEWPRWIHEGSPCEVEGCAGRRVPYKLSADDTGLDVPADYWAQSVTEPEVDAYAGEAVCSDCSAMTVIGLDEVQLHKDDVPAANRGDNVIPLFGVREMVKP